MNIKAALKQKKNTNNVKICQKFIKWLSKERMVTPY